MCRGGGKCIVDEGLTLIAFRRHYRLRGLRGLRGRKFEAMIMFRVLVGTCMIIALSSCCTVV